MKFKLKNNKNAADWFEYVAIKRSSLQQKIDEELFKQVEENGIFTIFDKSNSKEEILKRLNDREDKKHKLAVFRFKKIAFVIGVLMAVFTGMIKLISK